MFFFYSLYKIWGPAHKFQQILKDQYLNSIIPDPSFLKLINLQILLTTAVYFQPNGW